MAIDTANKRFSILGLDSPNPVALPKPTGTVGAAERQNFLRKYLGILFGVPATTTVTRSVLASRAVSVTGNGQNATALSTLVSRAVSVTGSASGA